MAGEANWLDHKDIDRWAAEHREYAGNKDLGFAGEDDPIDELQQRIDRGDFMGKNKASVQSYVRVARAKAYRLSDEAKVSREERAVAAAEKSARWAGWAIAVSVAALALSAWPYIKDWMS